MLVDKNKIVCISIMFLTLVCYISGIPMVFLFLFQIVIVTPFLLLNRKVFFKNNFYELLIIIIFVLSTVVSIVNKDYRPIFLPVYLFYSYLFAEYLLTMKNISKVFLVVFYAFVFWFIACGLFYGFSSSSINKYMVEGSRNGVSWVAITLVMIYYVSILVENKIFLISPSIICFVICIICFGRSGILISGLIFLLVIYQRSFRFANVSKKILFLILFLLILFLFLIKLDDVFYLLENRTNFSRGIESPRGIINSEYLDNMDITGVLWGYDPNNIQTVINLNGNVHNSYIYFHSRSGFVMLIFFIAVVLKLATQIKTKNFLVFFFFLVFFLVRISVDIVAFPGLMDFLFMYIILACNYQKET